MALGLVLKVPLFTCFNEPTHLDKTGSRVRISLEFITMQPAMNLIKSDGEAIENMDGGLHNRLHC